MTTFRTCGRSLRTGLVACGLALAALGPVSWAAPQGASQGGSHSGVQGAPSGPLLPRDSVDAAIFRGSLVYTSYCVTCHGANADGNGRAARLYTPRPANLRTTDKNNDYVALIVRRGGEALGRSPAMPPWSEELTDEQVNDVVHYVRSLQTSSTASR